LDSTPVECGRSLETVRRSQLAEVAGYGYRKSHSRWFWGMRLHLACAPDGTPRAAALVSADRPEREVALTLLPRALNGGETIICDKGYAGREFAEAVAKLGATILRPPRQDEPHQGPHLAPIRQRITLADDTEIGTLIDEPAAELVERRVRAAVADGAVLLTGGERRGAQLVPPVLDRVEARHELVTEETFGPAIPVLRVRNLDEALAVANGTPFGLSAGVVSNDLAAVTRCIRELRCGTVNIDEVPGFRTEATPFGGVKASGLGIKEGVVEAMRGMTNTKLFSLPWP
jgi:hypothetical protein